MACMSEAHRAQAVLVSAMKSSTKTSMNAAGLERRRAGGAGARDLDEMESAVRRHRGRRWTGRRTRSRWPVLVGAPVLASATAGRHSRAMAMARGRCPYGSSSRSLGGGWKVRRGIGGRSQDGVMGDAKFQRWR
jgi:hypothetical protein